ncbi:two-component regulator propeller domain-containing protein [Pseudoalteromonas rubra]|uniref:two-component regulator propeller domain-containing protein n=1 Tax=Pseudoalteromonas rubra TaxID=43658 RepID=UPI000F76B210|nr:two-component regulator propeller domain-containing protein [Pseudoalteromonas rubra]
MFNKLLCQLIKAPGLIAALVAFFVSQGVLASAFVHLNNEQGLSQNIIFDMVQDHQGYLWLATQDGLNRYDGKEFTVFRPNQANATDMTDGYIYPLALSEDNHLFLGTKHGGINRLLLSDLTFQPPLLKAQRISALLIHEKAAYIGTFKGDVYRYQFNTQQIERLFSVGNAPVYALHIQNSLLWVGSHGQGLHHFDLDNHKTVHVMLNNTPLASQIHASLFAFEPDKQGGLWIASQGGGLYHVNAAQKTLTHFSTLNSPLHSNELRDVTLDAQGRLWIASRGGGGYLFDTKSQHWAVFKHDPFDPYSLAHDRVYSVLVDNTGFVWFGTANGVSKLDPATLNFTKLNQANGLSNKDAWALMVDPQQRLWYGSWGGGIDIFDNLLNRVAHFDDQTEPTRLSSNAIKALAQDSQGNTWVGHWQNGLDMITPDGSVINYNSGNSPLRSDRIYTLAEDNQGGLWVGTRDAGLQYLNTSTRAFSALPEHPALNHGRISAIYPDEKGQIWIASDGGGLLRFDPASGLVKQYLHDPDKLSLAHNSVRGITKTHQQTLWLTTARGLSVFDLQARRFVAHPAVQHFAAQSLYEARQDIERTVWISTNQGLWRWETTTNSTTHFQAKNGLQGNEFNAGAALSMADGRLIFGGTQGLTLLAPPFEVPSPVPARLILSGLTADQSAQQQDMLRALNDNASLPIKLSHDTLRLSLQFDYLHFKAPALHQFQYRLKGFENHWQSVRGNKLLVNYTGLPPGDYVLQVSVSGDDKTTAASFQRAIVIAPPWYQSIWGYALQALGVCVLILLLFFAWSARLRQQKNLLAKQVALRTAQIAEQKYLIESQAQTLADTLADKRRFITRASHELRTPLSLILAPSETLLAQEKDGFKRQQLSLIQTHTLHLKSLIDRLLQLARYDHDPDLNQVSNFSAIAVDLCHVYASQPSHNVQFYYDIEPNLYVTASADALKDLLNNLLSNAFKYTTQGHVRLSLTRQQSQLSLCVEDSGKGIAANELDAIFTLFYRAEQSHTQSGLGIGLSIVKEIVDKLQGQINVASTPGQGSRFEVTFKIPAHITPDAQSLANDVTDQSPPLAMPETLASNRHRLILIAEDNADLRAYLAQELAQLGQVLCAENGIAALELAQFHVPDLILSDVMMPKLDGLGLLTALKNHPATSHIPTLLLTAKQDEQTRLNALAENCLDVLAKPFSRNELLMKVANVLRYVEHYPTAMRENNATELMRQDVRLLNQLNDFLASHYSDSALSPQSLAKAVALSERQLQRKLRLLVGCSPLEYLRNYRLEKAASLLKTGLQISVVASQTGFTSRTHFSRLFKQKFASSPKDFQNSKV